MTEDQRFLRKIRDEIGQQGRVHSIAWDYCDRVLTMLEEERAVRLVIQYKGGSIWYDKELDVARQLARRELYGDEG